MCFTFCAGRLSWLGCRWFPAEAILGNTVVLMLQAGIAQELRRSSPGRDALLEGWMCPSEGDEGGMCSSSSHWLLPTQLVLLSPRDCPTLLLGDLCMNPEGKGMGDEPRPPDI